MANKILVVGMVDSVHLARWLQQFAHDGHDFRIFPSSPHRRVHPLLQELISKESESAYSIVRGLKRLGVPLFLLSKLSGDRVAAQLIMREIRQFKPNIVHAIELQHAGYLCLKTFDINAKGNLKFLVTNYGSDLYWFARFEKHKRRLERLLQLADGYAAECERDVQLARDLGFTGRAFPVSPNAGGFPSEILAKPIRKSSQRNILLLKGYHGWVGRAKVGLEAIRLIASELRGFEVVVFSSNLTTWLKAVQVRVLTRIPIKVYLKGRLSHGQMLDFFSKSKIYVGLSLSDGISTSMLEAMSMGAIPVQTATSCCDEWFDSTGVKIVNLTPQAVAEGIKQALVLAETSNSAEINKREIVKRASSSFVSAVTAGFYD